MSPEEKAERPRAVTVIGWIWLVLAALWLFRSLVNLLVWKVMQPAVPGLLGVIEARSPQAWFLRPLMEHFATAMTVQALLSVALGVTAWQFLRLRPWARVAVQAVCWIVFAYVTAFVCLWIAVWTRASGEQGTLRMMGFAAGLLICLVLAAGQIVMISKLRSPGTRDAFAHRAKKSLLT